MNKEQNTIAYILHSNPTVKAFAKIIKDQMKTGSSFICVREFAMFIKQTLNSIDADYSMTLETFLELNTAIADIIAHTNIVLSSIPNSKEFTNSLEYILNVIENYNPKDVITLQKKIEYKIIVKPVQEDVDSNHYCSDDEAHALLNSDDEYDELNFCR